MPQCHGAPYSPAISRRSRIKQQLASALTFCLLSIPALPRGWKLPWTPAYWRDGCKTPSNCRTSTQALTPWPSFCVARPPEDGPSLSYATPYGSPPGSRHCCSPDFKYFLLSKASVCHVSLYTEPSQSASGPFGGACTLDCRPLPPRIYPSARSISCISAPGRLLLLPLPPPLEVLHPAMLLSSQDALGLGHAPFIPYKEGQCPVSFHFPLCLQLRAWHTTHSVSFEDF